MRQGSPQVRKEALGRLALKWVERDPGAAIDYAQKISDVGLRNEFVESAVSNFSRSDPVAAANWLSSGAVKLDASSSGVRGVSENYAKLDLGAAARWASSITEGALRNKALSAVSESWSKTNPTEAAKWVGSLQEVQVRDIATVAFSQELAKANPASAAQWASRISDPVKRMSSLYLIIDSWKKIDPNAARAFVLSSTAISEGVREGLLR
jgi:flagellar hook assembly protein FlgD